MLRAEVRARELTLDERDPTLEFAVQHRQEQIETPSFACRKQVGSDGAVSIIVRKCYRPTAPFLFLHVCTMVLRTLSTRVTQRNDSSKAHEA